MPDMFAMIRNANDPVLANLRVSYPRLGAREREIAESLLDQAGRKPLSDKQRTLAGSLAERANAPPPPTTDGLLSIVDMLDRAAATLKWPVV